MSVKSNERRQKMPVKSIDNLEAMLLGMTYQGFSYTRSRNHTTLPDILYRTVYSWSPVYDKELMDKYDCSCPLEEPDWPTGLRTDEVVTFDETCIDFMY